MPLEQILGPRIVHRLKVITGALVKNVDEDLASLIDADRQLRAAASSIYPKAESSASRGTHPHHSLHRDSILDRFC